MELSKKWDNAVNDKSSSFSLTGENGDKLKVKKDGFSFKKALTAAWMALTITTVAVSAITMNEWMDRMDHIKSEIKSGKIDVSKEAVDAKFFVERGANFKDSFIGATDKISDKIKNVLGMEKEENKIENNGMAKNLISFVKNEESQNKNKVDNDKKLKI